MTYYINIVKHPLKSNPLPSSAKDASQCFKWNKKYFVFGISSKLLSITNWYRLLPNLYDNSININLIICLDIMVHHLLETIKFLLGPLALVRSLCCDSLKVQGLIRLLYLIGNLLKLKHITYKRYHVILCIHEIWQNSNCNEIMWHIVSEAKQEYTNQLTQGGLLV